MNDFVEFEFTSISELDIADKLGLCKKLQDLLNNNISIKDYGNIIPSIIVIYQSFKKRDKGKLPKQRRSKRRTGIVELYLNIDYNEVLKNNENTILNLLAKKFLDAIPMFLNFKVFDANLFHKDIKKILDKKLKVES